MSLQVMAVPLAVMFVHQPPMGLLQLYAPPVVTGFQDSEASSNRAARIKLARRHTIAIAPPLIVNTVDPC
jgi:hypothetical protein